MSATPEHVLRKLGKLPEVVQAGPPSRWKNRTIGWKGYTLVEMPDSAAFHVFKDGEYVGVMAYIHYHDGVPHVSPTSRQWTLEEAINEPSSQPHPVPHRGAQ